MVFDYVAEQSDELSISVGDVVEVLKKDQEGWWEVRGGEGRGGEKRREEKGGEGRGGLVYAELQLSLKL